jgi:small subunit ribosomal protein S14
MVKKFGRARRTCRKCGRSGTGIIRKYGLYYCRQCFREEVKKIGFKKYS